MTEWPVVCYTNQIFMANLGPERGSKWRSRIESKSLLTPVESPPIYSARRMVDDLSTGQIIARSALGVGLATLILVGIAHRINTDYPAKTIMPYVTPEPYRDGIPLMPVPVIREGVSGPALDVVIPTLTAEQLNNGGRLNLADRKVYVEK